MPNLDPDSRIAAEELEDFRTVTPSSEFLCDDGRVRTWREMIGGIDAGLAPDDPGVSDEERAAWYLDLLWSFDAKRIS
ncbi:MAG: hypothetical protein LIV26_00285 [Atopobium sp.]|jgi:hypothetical protein|nr:hypothetical protein [Olsenella sp.]MCC6106209.1 hypothetical protein [Atopobium sp.]MCI1497946.1 hypothetical protein [Atopobiaceae bacterium]